jgi:Skp family chaperone for outer membrane proteins
MKKQFLFLFLALQLVTTSQAQSKGTKVGYIDMEYILQNVPDYTEAKSQLEQKAQNWKQEIETKKKEINKLDEALKAERALLTRELIEERETEIKFLNSEMLDFQQKRFGPNGDLMIQKAGLAKPIQDQVFTAVQDIAEAKKYDFIIDKSSDLTVLFAAKRFDISDQVLRVLNRTEKREQLTKKQLKEQELKENKEDEIDANPLLSERQKALEVKKLAREKLITDKKLAQEQSKLDYEARRKQLMSDREAKKNGTVSASIKQEDVKPTDSNTDITKTPEEEAKQKQNEERAKTIADRQKIIDERKKALEEKRKKILEEREATKKANEQKIIDNKTNN